MSGKQDSKVQIGRLSLREEGEFWVAYYAHPNTMELALPLGKICMAGIVDNPERKKIFQELMQEIVSDIIEDITGHRPTWGAPQAAPERERGVKP